ncbi:hypothetical protein C0J52_26705 [Blattella germanica]|nr:hypothetical protein C0J52_26705 [Blattella germanica]
MKKRCCGSITKGFQEPRNVNDLPVEIMIEIFSYLSAEEIMHSVRNTCLRWHTITFEKFLWSKVPFIPSPHRDSYGKIFIIPQHYLPYVQYIEIHHTADSHKFLQFVSKYFHDIKIIKYKTKNGIAVPYATELLEKHPKMRCLESYCLYFGMHLDYAQIFGKYHEKNRVEITKSTHSSEIIAQLMKNMPILNILFFQANLTREIFHLICDCPNLRHLIINCIDPWCEVVDFGHLMRLKNLKTLQIRSILCSNSYSVVNQFQGERLPHLTKIEILEGGQALERSLNTLLAACPNLIHLNVRDNILTDESLENIQLCNHLEYLDVSENFQLSDIFLTYVAIGCHRLKFLDITNCRCITDAFVLILYPCIKLEILCVEGFEFKGLYFNMIPYFYPKLFEFHLRHFGDDELLESLNLTMPGLLTTRCIHNHHF